MELVETAPPEKGTLPSDWRMSKVGAEFDVQLGKMLDQAKNAGVAKPYLGNRSVQWGRILTDDLDTMRMSPEDLQRYRLEEGDLLVCEGGEVGRAAIWDVPIPECYYQKALHRLRARNGYDPRLMVAFLRHWTSTDALSGIVTQTSIAHLTKEKLEAIPLPVPPPHEQEAIASALDDFDALLADLDALIEKKRGLKTGAMQRLLTGRQRLAGLSGEWETKPLGEIATLGGGMSASRADLSNEGHRYLHYGDIHVTDRTHAHAHEHYDNMPRLDIPLGKAKPSSLLEDGDVAFVDASEDEEGASRYVVAVNPSGVPFISGLHTIVAKGLTTRFDTVYLRYAFQAPAVKAQFRFYAVGTKVSGVSKSNLAKIEVPIPQRREQEAIAAVLSDMDAEIAALEARRAKAAQIREGMMQELLTGRTRLV